MLLSAGLSLWVGRVRPAAPLWVCSLAHLLSHRMGLRRLTWRERRASQAGWGRQEINEFTRHQEVSVCLLWLRPALPQHEASRWRKRKRSETDLSVTAGTVSCSPA